MSFALTRAVPLFGGLPGDCARVGDGRLTKCELVLANPYNGRIVRNHENTVLRRDGLRGHGRARGRGPANVPQSAESREQTERRHGIRFRA
jgi:hypothetical protein